MMKFVYRFGEGKADGSAEMKELLGGKGANLAEMANIGLPVPPGFTITTEACVEFMRTDRFPSGLEKEIRQGLSFIEKAVGRRFGDPWIIGDANRFDWHLRGKHWVIAWLELRVWLCRGLLII